MATIEEEPPLSPRTEAMINRIRQAVRTGEAQLKEDFQDRIQIAYASERAKPLDHVDESKAHTIQEEKDDNDIDIFLGRIDAMKQSLAPSFVVTGPTKVAIGDLDQYEEGRQFTRSEKVLGEGSSGKIGVVKDKETGTEDAEKKVKLSDFKSNEVRRMVDLANSDYFPSLSRLLLYCLVVLHMEKLDGVTLTDIYRHMPNLRQKAPELIRPFSLWMLREVLSAVGVMHGKGWAHCDLHGGNVMIIINTMKWKVLDLGMVQPLWEGLDFNHDAWKKDILDAIRLFCGVYIRQDFADIIVDNFTLENKIKAGMLKKVLMETAHLSKEDREKLLQLIEKIYELTVNPQQEGYRSTSTIIKWIDDMLSLDEMRDEMRKAMEILFPDFYRADGDINLRERGEEEAVDKESDDVNQEATGKERGEEEAVDKELDDFNQEATGKVIDDFLGLDISDKDV